MTLQPLQMPKHIELVPEGATNRYGKFIMQPLERGFGTTVGNSLRRVLLSSLPGAAVTAVKVDGALHEFTTLPGVVEDLAEIILNIKALRLKLHSEGPKTVKLEFQGAGDVTASAIQCDETIEILNPDLHIATLSEDGKLVMDLRIDHGRGYVQAKENRISTDPIGVIPIDSVFAPVTRVKFWVEDARVGHRTDYDRIILEIWTDGSLTPSESLIQAATILIDHFKLATDVGRHEEVDGERDDLKKRRMKELLRRPVSELELSVRSSNCLRQANIRTLGDLVQKTEQEMLKYQNFGRKSLGEIAEMLEEIGLAFGMNVSPYLDEEETRVAPEGDL
jgi:DNA-directed RNA polymerase subunit alpha